MDLYGDIFDEVGNDTAVLQLLVSPTRQAVNLARAYDAKDRGDQTDSRPAYLGVIDELRRQAESLLPEVPGKIDDDQLSLFNEPERTENVFDSFGFDFPEDDEPEGEKEPLPEEPPDGLSRFPDEDRAEDTVLPPPAPIVPAADSEEKTPDQELDDFADSVAAFLADFGVDGEDTPKAETPESDAPKAETPAAETPEAPAESKPEEPAPVREAPQPPVQKESAAWSAPVKSETPATLVMPNVPEMKERVPVVGLLVLFIIVAIPVGLVCIGAMLSAAVLCLGLSAAALSAGFYGFVTAFTAFSVFADILLVFGLSLALTALGLLLFWVFVWLLGGAIPGFVRGLINFADKHCSKEVSL